MTKLIVDYIVPLSMLFPSKEAGGSRVHVLVCLPSFTPSLAKFPSFKHAAASNIGNNRTPVPVKTMQTCSSNFGGWTSAGHGSDKYAGRNFQLGKLISDFFAFFKRTNVSFSLKQRLIFYLDYLGSN